MEPAVALQRRRGSLGGKPSSVRRNAGEPSGEGFLLSCGSIESIRGNGFRVQENDGEPWEEGFWASGEGWGAFRGTVFSSA